MGRTVVSSDDMIGARVAHDDNRFAIILELDVAAAMRLFTATIGHIGRPLAIVANGEVMSAPALNSPVADVVRIDGSFTQEEAEGLVRELTKTLARKKQDR